MANAAQFLGDLPIGAAGTVRRVGGDRPVARRLMEMGILPGTEVEIVRVAPLGDPLQLRVRGYSLSIRRAQATAVEVTDVRLPESAACTAVVTEPGG